MKRIFWKYGFMAGLGMLLATTAVAQQTYRSSGNTKKNTPVRNQKEKGFDASRLIYGGGLFGGGGSNTIAIGASPVIGYNLTDFWSAGISLGYRYFFFRDYFAVYNATWHRDDYYNLNNHIFVPGVWTRFKLFRYFFTHFEFEQVVSTYKYHDVIPQNNYEYINYRVTESVPCLLLGGGIRQPMGENASFVLYALYDVLQNTTGNTRPDPNNPNRRISRSPYARTIDIRIGVNIGF